MQSARLVRRATVMNPHQYREGVGEPARWIVGRASTSAVRVVPVVAAPGEVGVLVLTRDRWSLRPEPDYRVKLVQAEA